jgi:aerobic-type carbon monoxide dehydrogenase small subunit (CoxS/CutS family)
MGTIIQFFCNGKKVRLETEKDRMLLWAIRTDLGLTGTKYGCGEGLCGACTVLVDNDLVRSCRFPLEQANGKEVLTIEGLRKNGKLHPVQSAFIKHNAFQCGFCTSGMILHAYSFLLKNPDPTEEEIKEEMEDNLCRCGTYTRVVLAVQTAARSMRGGRIL